MAHWQIQGRELYARGADALEQQMWLNRWLQIHSELVVGAALVSATATIPPEEVAPDEENPNPNGTTGKAELNVNIILMHDDPDVIQPMMHDVILQLSSNEVIGWMSAGGL